MIHEIRHFLILYDIGDTSVGVTTYDDYEEAIAAYTTLEEEQCDRSDLDVVLLSADSIETVRRTHSSYFETSKSFERLLPRGVPRTV